MTNVELHIDRLILDGVSFGAVGQRRLQGALQARLTDLLVAGAGAGELLAGGSVERLRATPIALRGRDDPAAFGAQLADAVYGTLRGGQAR